MKGKYHFVPDFIYLAVLRERIPKYTTKKINVTFELRKAIFEN